MPALQDLHRPIGQKGHSPCGCGSCGPRKRPVRACDAEGGGQVGSTCPERGAEHLLGKARDNCRGKEIFKGSQHLTKFELQQIHALQRQITGLSSLGYCTVAPVPQRETVDVVSWEEGSACWQGVQTCGSKFCVYCQARHRSTYADDLDEALYAVELGLGLPEGAERDERRHTIVLGVLTCSNRGLELPEQLDALHDVWARVKKRAEVRRLREDFAEVGNARGDEVMILTDEERYHPHMHVAFGFDRYLEDEEIERLGEAFVRHWCAAMAKKGIHAAPEQQRLERARPREAQGGDGAQYRYVAKGVAQEVTGGLVKVGKNGSVSHFGLLVKIWRMVQTGGDQAEIDRLVALYKRTEGHLAGRRFTHISKTLNERGKLLEEREEDPPEVPEVLVQVPVPVHQVMRDLGVESITPALCVKNEAFLVELRSICEAYQRGSPHDPAMMLRSTISRLEHLYGGLAHCSPWRQVRLLYGSSWLLHSLARAGPLSRGS